MTKGMTAVTDHMTAIRVRIKASYSWRCLEMPELEMTRDLLILVSPLIAIQLGLAIYCVVKICREGVANLSRWAWILICLLANIIGPICFLIIGRRKDL